MSSERRLMAILSGLLVGMGIRSLIKTLKDRLPSGEKAWLIALTVGVLILAFSALLWAIDWI